MIVNFVIRLCDWGATIITRPPFAAVATPKITSNCRNSYPFPGQILHGDIMLKTEEYLVETADRCIRLAREGHQLVARLEAISNELMAKAVELDTRRDKNQKGAGGTGQMPTP
jgi:hypothetical protein